MNTQKQEIFWNRSHKKYIEKGKKNVSSYAIEKERLFPRDSAVLDLGGGRGIDSIYFSKNGHTVTLADVSTLAMEEAEKQAKKEKQKLKTIQINLDMGELPFNESTFDIVYSRLSLHYFNNEITTTLFKEIYRILKKGGKTYLTFKSPEDKDEYNFLRNNAEEIESGVFIENGNTKTRYTQKQLEGMLEKASIKDYSVSKYVEKLNSIKDYVKSGGKQFILNEVIINK